MVGTHWRGSGSLTSSSSARAWAIGRREWLLLATVVLLPLPLVALTGAGLPLPGLVEHGLESLLPSAGAPGRISAPSRSRGPISGVVHRSVAGRVHLPTAVHGDARLPTVPAATRAATTTVPVRVATTPAAGITAVATGGAPASGTTGHKRPATPQTTRLTGSRATLVRSSTSPAGGPSVGSLSPGRGGDASGAGAVSPPDRGAPVGGSTGGSSSSSGGGSPGTSGGGSSGASGGGGSSGHGGAGSGNGAGGTVKTPVGSLSLGASGSGGSVSLRRSYREERRQHWASRPAGRRGEATGSVTASGPAGTSVSASTSGSTSGAAGGSVGVSAPAGASVTVSGSGSTSSASGTVAAAGPGGTSASAPPTSGGGSSTSAGVSGRGGRLGDGVHGRSGGWHRLVWRE